MAVARGAVRQIVDFALPPRCPGCGAVTAAQHLFCIACWQSLRFLGDPCCARCGLPFDYDGGEGAECGACIADPPPFDRMRAAVAYGPVARKVVLALKYGGRPGAAETLGHFMQRHLAGISKTALVAPVPLHRWRIWSRGYNQAALMASALARRGGLEVELDLLRRVKGGPPMRGMGRRERALAVRGAFALSQRGAALVQGREIVLVDDVFTTGATARACAKLLKRSGAARVDIICWARVVPGSED